MSAPARCDGCGVNLLPDSAFCHECGNAVATPPPSAIRGERKPITVLFIDAFGSIGLGDRLDAEQWHDIVESFFSVVSTGVQHFGGTIDRLTGEGIKILFGAPLALENHATQACHAALHIAARLGDFAASFRARAGVEFSVRMGLASGEAVFGQVGSSDASAFTSQGHTAALAARMQQLAAPGRIYLTEHTAALVKDYFDLREMGPLSVRNANRRVQVFELVGAREHQSRLDAARERGLTPFVGRDAELAELEQSLLQAIASGHRLVGIVGDPGIGKSRLVEEFVERQRARGAHVRLTRCAEHARWIPFHATRTFLGDTLGVDTACAPETARARVEQALAAVDPTLVADLPVVLTALGIASGGEAHSAGAASAPARVLARVVRRLIEARGSEQPSLFVLDDQQWMDAASDAVIAELVADPPRNSVLVLMTYRRNHRRRWMRAAEFTELPLRPLERSATLQLVRTLLGDDRSLAALQERIADRAAGNPYFVEETVLALADSGALAGARGRYRLQDANVEIIVPGTLHAVLAARVDQLPEREKDVLRTAAVIGREFPVALLSAVLDCTPQELAPLLRSLEEADFVSALGWGGSATHHFRHPLLRETVYRSLLREHRERLHRRVASELQRMHGERAREHAAQLALHFEAAGDDLDAARWHRVAARSAVRWDPVQAFGHWRRVLSCAARCDASDEEAARLRLLASEAIVRLGFHHGLPRDEAERLVQDGVRLAARLGDRRAEVLLLSADGALRAASGEIAAAIDLQARAVELAEQGGDAELAMLVGARLVLTLRGAGRLREAARRADALLAAHRSAPIAAPTPGLFAVRQLELARVVTLLDLGQLDTGAAELTRIIAALREENAPLVLAWALSLTAGVIRHTGDAAPALVARVEEARTIAQQLGVPSAIGRALTTIATVRLFEQRWSETIACAEEALDLMRDVGHPNYFDPDPRLLLSYARYASGDVAGARAAAHDALQHAFTSGAVLGQIDALLAYGRLLVRYGSAAEVEAGRRMLRHGLALVHRCRARSREPVFWFELAGVARRAGDLRRALANQRRGGRLFVAMNAFGHLRRSAALMDTPAQPERRSGD